MTLSQLRKICTLAAGVTAATLSTSISAEEPLRLNFGVYSSNKPSAMVKVFRPVLKELEVSMTEKLGKEVDIRMQIAKDYDQGISHLINGRVDFSRFGPASYIEANRMNEDINILAVENIKNSKVFYGIIAVAKDSPIKSISDLRGKSFAFGDEGSTIGRFLSQLYLEQSGIRAGDLSRYEYLGRHDKVGTAVGAGSFDAGALNEKTFKKLVDAGENIRELVRFPNVTKPWIARSNLDEDILAALRESLLSITNKKILATMKIDGFLEGDDRDYSVIRQAMENNQAFFEEREEEIVEQSASPVQHRAKNKTEPTMQAAVSKSDAVVVTEKQLKNTAPVNTTSVYGAHTPAPTVHQGMPAAGDHMNRHITVNITLPNNLFDAGNYTGPNSLTINLSIPSDNTAGAVVPATQ